MNKRYILDLSADELAVLGALVALSTATIERNEAEQAKMLLCLMLLANKIPGVLDIITTQVQQADADVKEHRNTQTI